jgi:hypothetical protein
MLFQFGPADPQSERDYWLARAEKHLALGEQCSDTRASWAHYQLAGRYLDKAYGPGQAASEEMIVAVPIDA